ncbi:MAG: HEAT repeat domain-containing protein [Phycisphaerae bacterium]|nr:HEAT repeat domain-containing protein [Phycisphaerae bacterium]
MVSKFRIILWLCLCLAAIAAAGCNSREQLYRQFQDEDPDIRLRAIRQAGELKDPKAVPYLVDRLTDSESDVRFFAILALEKVTGRTMGYRYWDPPAKRAEAVQKWRDYLQARGDAAPATQPGQ